MLFASILNSSVMLGNNLQQTASADDIFECIFSWHFKGLRTATSSLLLSKMIAEIDRTIKFSFIYCNSIIVHTYFLLL